MCADAPTQVEAVVSSRGKYMNLKSIFINFSILVNISIANVSADTMKIETPEGTISATQSTVEPTPQKVTIVRGKELILLHKLGANGPEFVGEYFQKKENPELKDYDRAFHNWQKHSSPKYSSTQVVETLGGHLGNKCVKDLSMEWVKVTDEYGTDYAIRSKATSVIAYPFSTVLKRIEKNEYDFMYGVYYTIKQMIESGEYESKHNSHAVKTTTRK